MAELPNPFTCDICGRTKGETNHWWRVWHHEIDGIVITPWNRLVTHKHFHGCGEEHALRLAAKLLNGIAGPQPQWTTDGPILTEEPKAE